MVVVNVLGRNVDVLKIGALGSLELGIAAHLNVGVVDKFATAPESVAKVPAHSVGVGGGCWKGEW